MKDKKRSYYKELKQPDEFVGFWHRVIEFAVEHKREFLLGGAGVLLLVGMAFAGAMYLQSREDKAAGLLSSARASLEAVSATGVSPEEGTFARPGREDEVALREAVSELEHIADRYGRTQAGHRSRLLLGQLHYERGDYEAALRFYEALEGRRGIPAEVRALAWEGLAYVHEEMGDLARAAAYYEKVAKGRVLYLRPWAWMGLARCYEEMGDLERAVDAYNRFLSDFPFHPSAAEARALLSRIYNRTPAESAVPGVEGEPPPAGNGY